MMQEIDELKEEIFCLKAELDTLAGVLLRSESERWVPGFLYRETEHSHIERYLLACRYAGGKDVMDIACGVGKGTFVLATEGKAKTVEGYDIQEEAVRYARWRNKTSNVSFGIGDAEHLNIKEKYDLVVSFETVEHLKSYQQFIQNIYQSLKADGMVLISTPISALPIDVKPSNPFHVQEWGFIEFQDLLKQYFHIEKIYVQLYPAKEPAIKRPPGILTRAGRKIKNLLFNQNTEAEGKRKANSSNSTLSKIEEYAGQYPISELGSIRTGYQIILARKNGYEPISHCNPSL